MTQRAQRFPGIEVSGQAGLAILAALGPHRGAVERAFAKASIFNMAPDSWYPLDVTLDAFDTLAQELGGGTLFGIGKRVHETAVFPPDIRDIQTSLRSIDVAYHLTHRRDGRPMYNLQTGEMVEGIGHYLCHFEGKRRAVMVCDTPYLAEIDRGIITAMARRFEAFAEVERDPSKPSRLEGGPSCTFVVTW